MSNLTVKEMISEIQASMSVLSGKNPLKLGGISSLVKMAAKNCDINLEEYGIEVKNGQFELYCSAFNKNIVFARVRPVYKEDKRKSNGRSDYLESVVVYLEKNVPEDLTFANFSQWLSFQEAKSNFNRLAKEQSELMAEYESNLRAMKELQDVMKYEAYDAESKKEAENAEEMLGCM